MGIGDAAQAAPSAEEYEKLRRRLEEAEEILRAIREGEIDALIIGGDEGGQVYTVKSADEPYRIMVEQMREGAVTLGVDGAVLYCNPRFAEMVRMPANQIIGKDILPFIASGERAAFAAMLVEIASTGPRRLETSLRAADGALVPAYLSGNVMALAGAPTLSLLITDLTQQRQMSEQLRQSQKVEAIGQLTAGMAHDFNNLLTAAIGNLELAERRSTDAKVTALIHRATRAAERGARLTEQLLAFSRKQHLLPKAMDVNQIVTGMGDLLRTTMGGIINIERVLKPDLWPALVDPNQIELVILNLAINARDAMPLGGTLTIETSNLRIAEPREPGDPVPGEYVTIQLSDTGGGMPPEVQARAFEPFFTTKGPGKGSGLGLSMVQGVVAQLGGAVRIRSRVGEGTSVVLYLPRAASAITIGSAEMPPRAQAAAPEHARILLVDDDSDVREITQSLLSDLGYEVVEAPTGGVALEILDSGAQIDLMLIDFAMPGMNGTELARRAREKRPDIPLVFATGYADNSELAGAFRNEIVLNKPYRRGEFAAKVRAALGQAPGRRSNVLPLRASAAKAQIES